MTLTEAFGSNSQNSGVPEISLFPMRIGLYRVCKMKLAPSALRRMGKNGL